MRFKFVGSPLNVTLIREKQVTYIITFLCDKEYIYMKTLRSILFFLLGLLIIGIFIYLSWRFRDFFLDPGWKYSGDYRFRIEGGNAWYWLALMIPFVIGALLSFRQVEFLFDLWDFFSGTPSGLIISGIVLALIGVAAVLYLVYNFVTLILPKVKEGDLLAILGTFGLGCIIAGIFTASKNCFKAAKK